MMQTSQQGQQGQQKPDTETAAPVGRRAALSGGWPFGTRSAALTAGDWPRTTKVLFFLSLLILPLLAVQAVRMGLEVVHRLDGLSTAATDNMQWVLSQAEVEHLKLQSETLLVEEPADLANVRRQFDLYYSRINTFVEGPLFADMRDSDRGGKVLRRLQARRATLVELIDVPDAQLMQNRAEILAQLEDNGDEVRELALLGVSMQVKGAEGKRLNLFALLSRMAFVVVALVAALAITALLLGGMYRRGRDLARERSKALSRMEAMISSSLDAILVVDREGTILAFNGAAETIFGYSRDEAIGASMERLIIPPHLRAAHRVGMDRYWQTSEPRLVGNGRVQLEGLRKSGEVFPVEVSLSVSRSQADLVVVSYIRDISDRIAAEEALRRARDDALAGEQAKANLLTVMSHEMRTPLTGILGAVDLLHLTDPDEEQLRYLNAMQVSGELLLNHVNDILQLSSLEAGVASEEASAFDLRQILDGLIESQKAAASNRGNQLTLNYHIKDGDYVVGRMRALQQALLNLIGNAIKFTNDGRITVEVEHSASPGQIAFHVSDTGAGIAEQDQKRIFEDFITLDASFGRGSEGTGLGLAITRRIVDSLGGTITCESELGEGSLFTLTLPLTLEAKQTPEHAQDRPALEHSARILVVEDNDINRELLQKMLQNQGHQVTAAAGGAQAVESCRIQQFDLVLMDISMPEVDGIEAIHRIRAGQLAEGVEIVALTAHTGPEDHARILAAGFAEVATKPISGPDLAALVVRRAKGAPALITSAPQATNADPASGQSDITEFFETLGPERALGFLQSFIAEVAQFITEIQAGTELQPAQRKEAHRLAGSAAVLGLAELRSALSDIEMLPTDAPLACAALASNWQRVKPLLEAHLIQPAHTA
ncbi:hybrid sensor histidine kinase/response regulator [Pseudophaeobacter flagellatus]|uniref:hybrid sensor histidine kinase/response regulator n=1 Tax=Pseudophaeobacter flagellatus TaxID=2899119 RepID=UPI001E3A8068|nr:PAS domain-containing hybrid sensor histidine kinase/response regulator [Pseudophaeobacter flagellatus]MCD9146724.1 ATP-binding protein [Pseudophaeobacter flagellatus]